MSEPLISIITVNYNQTETTCALLDSIRRQDYRRVETWVVDNASRENPEQRFREAYPEVRFLRSPENLGFAGGNNLALRQATGDFIFFINNDAEITPGCLQQLLSIFQQHPNAGIVSPLICYFPENSDDASVASSLLVQYSGMTAVHPITGRNQVLGHKEPNRGQFSTPTRTAYAHGAAMMVSQKTIETVGPMYEGFFLYYEELDWCERIRRAGLECWTAPGGLVLHKESLTIGRMGALKTYYLTRSRIMFMRRNFPKSFAGFGLYFCCVTVPMHSLRYMLRREWPELSAFWRGALAGFQQS